MDHGLTNQDSLVESLFFPNCICLLLCIHLLKHLCAQRFCINQVDGEPLSRATSGLPRGPVLGIWRWHTQWGQDTARREVSRSCIHLFPASSTRALLWIDSYLTTALLGFSSYLYHLEPWESGLASDRTQVHLNPKLVHVLCSPGGGRKEGSQRGRNDSSLIYQSSNQSVLGSPERQPGKPETHASFLKSALSKSPYFDGTAKGSTILGSSYDKAEAVS